MSQADKLNDEELVDQLVLASLAQTPALAPAIEHVLLQRGSVQTVFVHGAYAALQYPVSEALAGWSRRWLVNSDTRRLAAHLLRKCGTDNSYQVLLTFARRIAATDPSWAAKIIACLPSEGAISREADALAVEIFNAEMYAVDVYKRVARCGGPTERATLRQRAYQAEASFLELRTGAIDALATIDPLEAARAALWLVEQVPKQESFAPDVVIRFGSDEQCLQLISLSNRLQRQSLWDHVGRAFRKRPSESKQRLLAEIRSRDELSFRRAFAELAGWLGEDQRAALSSRVAVEVSRAVYSALRSAQRRIEGLVELKATLSALDTANAIQAAALLRTALAANEPFLLSDPDDEMFLGKVVSRQSKYFRFFASKQLDDQRKNFKPSDE